MSISLSMLPYCVSSAVIVSRFYTTLSVVLVSEKVDRHSTGTALKRVQLSTQIALACRAGTIWFPTTLPFPVPQSLDHTLTDSVAFTTPVLAFDGACILQE